MASKDIPDRIYLETTELFTVPADLNHVELDKLLQLRDASGFEVVIPEVAWLEFVRHKRREIVKTARKVFDAIEVARKADLDVTNSLPLIDELIERARSLPDEMARRAAQKKLRIAKLPEVNIRQILQMSLDEVPPFEEKGEKGFRDELNCLCIESDCKDGDSIVIVTNDRLLRERLSTSADRMTMYLSADLKEANVHMQAFLEAADARRIEAENKEALRVLQEFKPQIDEKVSSIQELTMFPNFSLAAFSLTGGADKVKEVLAIRPSSLDSAIWKDRSEEGATILFSVRAEVVARVSTSAPASFNWLSPTFKVGGGPPQPEATALDLIRSLSQTEEKLIPRTLYGVAKLRKVDAKWSLESLVVESSAPADEKEFERLVASKAKK